MIQSFDVEDGRHGPTDSKLLGRCAVDKGAGGGGGMYGVQFLQAMHPSRGLSLKYCSCLAHCHLQHL